MKHLRFKAILAGLLLALGGQSLFGYLLMFVMLNALLIPRSVAAGKRLDISQSELVKITEDIFLTPTHIMVSLFIKVIFTMAGAFLTAHIAREKPMQNVLAVGAVLLLYSLSIRFWDPLPTWFTLLSLIGTIPPALIGGYWRAKTRKPLKPAIIGPRPPLPEIPNP
jgi:hypothetical protein